MRAFITLLFFASMASAATPNVVVIFADDLGYGDLGCYGETRWKTPHLDNLAKDGMRFTDFYVAQPVCSASRAALLTGCYPNRVGIAGALGPQAKIGISEKETTLAEVCKAQGYATGMVGKWHLGHHPQFLPTRHGFDSWLGLPYSNDMWPNHPEAKPGSYPNLPLFDGEKVIEPDVTAAVQNTLTERYTARAVDFITANKAKPFFLYVAHSMPHVPLHVGEKQRGKSAGGVYGDVIEEIDASVGRILKALDDTGVAKNTLVIFTSDNGPWLSYGNHAGTAGKLREGKGTCWDGGVRVPCIARLPGVIPANSVCNKPAMTIDVLPTVCGLIKAKVPEKIDGRDITPLLEKGNQARWPSRPYFFYYNQNELQAVRLDRWKLVLPHTYRTMQGQEPGKDGKPGKYKQVKLETAELYNLATDIGETKNVAAQNAEVMKLMLDLVDVMRNDLGDSLTKMPGKGRREPGRLAEDKPKKPEYSSELVFPLHNKHNHAPGIVELNNGELLVSWYRGSGERRADDVAVYGARKKPGSDKWSDAFVMADTPGFPDCNTTLWVDNKDRLWLFWPVIIANTWESCLTHYRVANNPKGDGNPSWDWQGTIYLKPVDFEAEMKKGWAVYTKAFGVPLFALGKEEAFMKRAADPLMQRLGWQPRCKPTVLKNGRILLPLYSDTYSAGLMAISDDGGQTWKASKPLAAFGGIQPAVLEKADGTLVAYMRENGSLGKIRVSESVDKGETWGPVGKIDLVNPGSGLDAVRLSNGHWAMVYNDTTRGRNKLALSISLDEGKTWPHTKHLEDQTSGSYHYPAIIQGKNGNLHIVYSYFVADGKSMKHVSCNEEWVMEK